MRIAAVILAVGAAAVVWPPDVSVAGHLSGLRSGAAASSQFEHINYRRCWVRDGKRNCRWVPSGGGADNATPARGAGRPENNRVGTPEWYRAMERDGRLNTGGM
jgi:hypothetical protein